jgi:hypothetical protein
MLKAKRLLVAGVLLLVGGALWGEEAVPLGMKVPEAGRVKGQRLLLPEVEGYLDAPGPGWVWYAQTGLPSSQIGFVCLDGQGGVFGALLTPAKGFLSPSDMGSFMAGARREMVKQGVRILAERCTPVVVPNHENVYRIALQIEMPNGNAPWHVSYIFTTGTYQIALTSYRSEVEPQLFKDFAAGLRFRKIVPNDKALQEARDNQAFRMMMFYAIWGCLIGGLAMFSNRVMEHRWASPAKMGLIAILVLLAVRLCLNGLTPHAAATGEGSMEHSPGRETGYAILPLILFVYLYYREWKKGRARAAQAAAASADGAPPAA